LIPSSKNEASDFHRTSSRTGGWADQTGTYEIIFSETMYKKAEFDPSMTPSEKSTAGLGMVYLHEAGGHARQGLIDEPWMNVSGDYCSQTFAGSAADYVNSIRSQIDLPLRINYVYEDENYFYVFFYDGTQVSGEIQADNIVWEDGGTATDRTTGNQLDYVRWKKTGLSKKEEIQSRRNDRRNSRIEKRQNRKSKGKSGNPFILQ